MKVYELKTLAKDGHIYSDNLPLFTSISTLKAIAEALAKDRGVPLVVDPCIEGNGDEGMFIQCRNVVVI